MNYRNADELKGKQLYEDDEIHFKGDDFFLEYCVQEDCDKYYLSNCNGPNYRIFAKLGIKSDQFEEFYKNAVGYFNRDGEFPTVKTLPDLRKLVLALYEKMNPLSMKGKEVKFRAGGKIQNFIKKVLKVETNEERIKWLRTFENCILPNDVKDVIDEALTVVLNSEKFDEWGINDHFEKGLTNSILLYGPSGTGKTMISEAFAAVLGMDLMKISPADVQSNVPGKTERNIIEIFKQAKQKNCVILLDECDSLLYDRNSVGAVMSSEINALLTEIENFDGVCVLTTNRLGRLDSALQRRIIAKIELPLPTFEARNMIWRKLIPSRMPISKLDYSKLSAPQMSGGEIKNAILLAARKAIARNSKEVTQEQFDEAITLVMKGKGDYAETKPRMIRQINQYMQSIETDKVRGVDAAKE